MRCYVKLSTVIYLMMTLAIQAQTGMSARQIIDKSFKTNKLAGSESISTMTISDGKGHKRVRNIAQISKLYDNGKTEKKLVRFLAPADVKGTGLLTFDYENKDDDMWLFMPALRKTRRIISSEKSKSFMGSEFSYSDMTPPLLDDFTFTLLGEEEIDGFLCYKIVTIPNNDDVASDNGFSKKISWIRKDIFAAKKAVYYDLDEEIHKELNILKYKKLDASKGKYRAVHLIMDNKQNNRKSILIVDKIIFNPNVKDSYFTTHYLENQ